MTPAESLRKAAETIEQRSGTHGDYKRNFAYIASRWSTYIEAKRQREQKDLDAPIALTEYDVAYMMIEMKLARALVGNIEEPDHLNDIQGYAALGSALLPTKSSNFCPPGQCKHPDTDPHPTY